VTADEGAPVPSLPVQAAGEAAGGPPADGLFDPESVTRRIMGEPIMWVAGLRALYLQALHPRVMRGTWQNTALADPQEAWGRFIRTAEFVGVRTFGSVAEVERAGRRIRKVHASLTGTDADGTRFRLDEPELLLWVHYGEVASYADIARRCGMPLSPGDIDAFVDEQRRGAAVVGLDPAIVPASAAELAAYCARMRPLLRTTPEARKALLRSVSPALPSGFLALKLVAPPLTTLAFATLPRWARRMYGVPASPLADLTASAALRACYQGSSGVAGQLLVQPAARAARQRMRAHRREGQQPEPFRAAS
jgi:uncharacterized protein (DUF2236 family)